MSPFAFLQKTGFLAMIFVVILSITMSAGQVNLTTTSYTTVTIHSTFMTVPSSLKEMPSVAPTRELALFELELEPQPEPAPEPETEREPEPEPPAEEADSEGHPGPHHITMSLPLPTLPSPKPTSSSQVPALTSDQPKVHTPALPVAPTTAPPQPQPTSALPPSTTWRWDPPPGQPNRTPRKCSTLEHMAWGTYRSTMGLCKKASKATEVEVKDMIREWRGVDFRDLCKVTPPIDCCIDRHETLMAKRC